MNSLDRSEMRLGHYLQAALLIGLGIITMHYVGMAALQTSAHQYYQTGLLLASIAIAIATSLLALLMARCFRQGSGTLYLLMKHGASVLMAAGIVLTHFTGMAAMTLVIQRGRPEPALRRQQPATGADHRLHYPVDQRQ